MRRLILALSLALLPVAGCGDVNWNDNSGGGHDSPDNSGNKYVAGTINSSPSANLPKDSQVIVRLVDRANGDLLSEQRIDVPKRGLPVPFQLRYDKDQVKERRTYDIEARIRVKGKLKWITKQRYPVITQGNPTYNLDIRVEPN